MALDLVSIVSGGILGASLTAANRWWQYRRENWYSRITAFCVLASAAANASSAYWLDEVDQSLEMLGKTKELKDARSHIAKQEYAIIGMQAELDGLYASFLDRLSFRDRPRLSLIMQTLGDALTGGDFQSRDRRSDPDRARMAHVSASDLIVDVRHSLDRAIKFRGLIEYAIQYPHGVPSP